MTVGVRPVTRVRPDEMPPPSGLAPPPDEYARALEVLVRAGFFSRDGDAFHLTPAGHRRMVETCGEML